MLHIRKLAELQKHNKVSQEKMANIIGVSRNGYQKKLVAEKSFFIEELQAIADYFGISITYFFEEERESTINNGIEKQVEILLDVIRDAIIDRFENNQNRNK